MSLFDKFGKKENSKELIGVASIEDVYLDSISGGRSAYLIISPVNLNVLSNSFFVSQVDDLAKSIEEIGSCELLAINSAQSYEHNKRFLSQCALREKDETVKSIDKQDIEFMDDIQARMATSREFLIRLIFITEDSKQIIAATEKARQILSQNGFVVRTANKHDMKRMLAIYFEQNIFDEEMQDFDGERFAPILEMKK